MNARVTAPGFYPDITPAEYFAEVCPAPALTNSLIKLLSPEGAAPAKAAYHHPAIGEPAKERKKTTALYMGGLVHRLALGKGGDYVLSPHDKYQSNEAKEWKAGIEAQGKIPMKAKDMDEAEEMAAVLRRRIGEVCGGFDYQTEVVMVWQEDVTLDDGDVVTIWCRGMLDFWCPDLKFGGDAKTCADASDDALQRWFYNSYATQDVWYLRGLQKLVGMDARFGFVFVEKEEPYLYRLATSTDAFRMGAWMACEKAMKIFATCLRDNDWPGYEPFEAYPTMWQLARWNDSEDGEIDV